ncbi:hypothetical protein PRIPAC_89359 [Pristionchus pacificus]|uniref:Uncharacterized protein n=1 Tax=Pristionchus pacificus TaxID=54126 RepID=A0A2A6B7H8_PRIPA|nr:hypothetical protein PRIPAC_89359 [Pristionchus pacificus]|eukprot:PDM61817.1 hypothetical protein PRIPAC_51259 [Pristionchus pacificus]
MRHFPINLKNATVDDLGAWMRFIRYEMIAHHVVCSFCALPHANYIILTENLLMDAFKLDDFS